MAYIKRIICKAFFNCRLVNYEIIQFAAIHSLCNKMYFSCIFKKSTDYTNTFVPTLHDKYMNILENVIFWSLADLSYFFGPLVTNVLQKFQI